MYNFIKCLVIGSFLPVTSGFASGLIELDLATGEQVPFRRQMRVADSEVECTLTSQQIEAAIGIVLDAQSYLSAIKDSLRASLASSTRIKDERKKAKHLPSELFLDGAELIIRGHMKFFDDNLVFINNALIYDLQLQLP
jgi:hypothetical protein